MQQNRVLRLLRQLSPTEFKGFNRFLKSPYFNTNPRIILFYEQLKKYYPVFDSPKLAREKLFKKLFPGKKYHYQQLANLITELTRLTEEYFIQLELKSNTLQKKKTLLQSYSHRDLYDLFKKDTMLLLNQLKKNEIDPQHLDVYSLLKPLFFHPKNHLLSKNQTQLNELMHAIDHFYWEEKLFLASEIKNMSTFLKAQITIPLFEEIKSIAKQKTENYTLQAYLLLFTMLESGAQKDFKKLNFFFESNFKNLNKELQITIFRSLNNYCVNKINSGQSQFYQDQFQIYQFGLENEFILNENIISYSSFVNICNAGIYSSNLKWVYDFIENYKNLLNPLIKEETLQIVFAVISFYERKYAKVNELLFNFKTDHSARLFFARKLQIRAYFELFLQDSSYYEIFESTCLSFEKLLYRNDVNVSNRIKANLNFVSIIKRVARLAIENTLNADEIPKIIEEIKTKDLLILRYWLINRLNKFDSHPSIK